ncbi:MAG: Hsp70 family protein, partial [Geminicoccaceae bacterium]|nr:Hsp70 family protein [Geminicoccaceae bacterium]
QQIRIQASGGLNDDEIEKMVQEAAEHAEEDKKRRELVEARNQADGLVYSTEKSLSEHGDKVDSDTRTSIEAALASLKEVMEGEDPDAINTRSQELAQVAMKLGEAMYAEQQKAAETGDDGDGSSGGSTGKDGDGVVDAEFEEVDDDNNSKRSA